MFQVNCVCVCVCFVPFWSHWWTCLWGVWLVVPWLRTVWASHWSDWTPACSQMGWSQTGCRHSWKKSGVNILTTNNKNKIKHTIRQQIGESLEIQDCLKVSRQPSFLLNFFRWSGSPGFLKTIQSFPLNIGWFFPSFSVLFRGMFFCGLIYKDIIDFFSFIYKKRSQRIKEVSGKKLSIAESHVLINRKNYSLTVERRSHEGKQGEKAEAWTENQQQQQQV